jgi:hypothetical protein
MQRAFCRPFAIAAAAALFFLAVPAAAPQTGSDVPPFRSYFGARLEDIPGGGVRIAEVFPNSPAAKADIQAGDAILTVDGRRVLKLTEVADHVFSHPPYDTIEIGLERRGMKLARSVPLSGRVRLEDLPVAKLFPIPGIDTGGEADVPDAVSALDRMNVLKRVLVDPRTGAIEFVGTYDPAFVTGPLPYPELLDEALRDPEPFFSLEGSPDMARTYRELYAKKNADFERMTRDPRAFSSWIQDWLVPLTCHPLLENERQLYLGRLAVVAGLTKAELALLMNYVTVSGARFAVPPEILDVQLKLLRNIGFDEEAALYALYREGTSKSLASAARGLGKFEQARSILEPMVSAGKSEAEMVTALRAFVGSELMIAIDTVPGAGDAGVWQEFKQGRLTLEALDVRLQQKIFPEQDSSRRSLIMAALNGMPLSNEMVRRVYDVEPGQVDLLFKNVRPDSHLGRIFYEADYVGKTLDLSQRVLQTLPGHRPVADLMSSLPFQRHVYLRFVFVPDEVPLFVAEGGAEVGFGASRVKLTCYAESAAGQEKLTPEELAAIQGRADAYVGQVVESYDDYARQYPSLHKLREAAKVIALAKWLNDRKIALRTGASSAPAWTPPARIPAIVDFSMSFSPAGTQGAATQYDLRLRLWLAGGVNFAASKNWVVLGPRPPSYVPSADLLTTSAALGDEAVRAALGGSLEKARELAELSARALTGDLDPSRLPTGLSLQKEGSPRPATPDEVRLVKAAIKAVQETTVDPRAEAGKAPDRDQATLLAAAGQAFRTGTAGPTGSQLLARLQSRPASQGLAPGGPGDPPRDAGAADVPPRFDCAAYLSRFSDGADLKDGQRAFLEAKISEIQDRLEKVRRAMDELGRLRSGDLRALEECQSDITEAYDEAQERALDALTMLLVDGPLDILKQRRGAAKEFIDQGIMNTLLTRNSVLGVENVSDLDRAAFGFFRLKYAFENVYGRAERLQATLSGARSLQDMDGWANSDKDDLEKLGAGVLQLTEMVLGDEKVGAALKIGKLAGDGILRFLSLYRATDAACGFFYDIMKQRFVWGPLVEELQRSLETNLRAVRTLQEKSRDLHDQLNCLRTGLR